MTILRKKESEEEEDEDFVKRDPDDTKERRYEAQSRNSARRSMTPNKMQRTCRSASRTGATRTRRTPGKIMRRRYTFWGGSACFCWIRDGLKLATGGAQQKDEPLVAEDTWKQLEHLLLYGTYAGSITALVVCTDEPPVDPYQRDDLPEESYARLAAISSSSSDREAFLGLMF